MSRYIDIEPYEKDGWCLQKHYHNSYGEVIKTTPLISVPTEDVEPVKHGRWKKWEGDVLTCSNCKHYWIQSGDQYDFNYCPNCGTRMDAQIGEDKSHPFAESVMMGMDGGEK